MSLLLGECFFLYFLKLSACERFYSKYPWVLLCHYAVNLGGAQP